MSLINPNPNLDVSNYNQISRSVSGSLIKSRTLDDIRLGDLDDCCIALTGWSLCLKVLWAKNVWALAAWRHSTCWVTDHFWLRMTARICKATSRVKRGIPISGSLASHRHKYCFHQLVRFSCKLCFSAAQPISVVDLINTGLLIRGWHQ
jgi:hypothetical protein